jgi:hypothetical protein
MSRTGASLTPTTKQNDPGVDWEAAGYHVAEKIEDGYGMDNLGCHVTARIEVQYAAELAGDVLFSYQNHSTV